MKPKTIILILVFVVLCATVWLVYVNLFDNGENTEEIANTTEITPGEEMTQEQERQTMISLYYTNSETNTIMPEARVIDAKELLENPYKTLIGYLIEAPKNEKMVSSIPKDTKVNGAMLNGNTVLLDLSKEFINEQSEEKVKVAIDSIVNTLTELNEVEAVKILIDGEEGTKVEGTNIVLNESYTRKNNEEIV